MSASVVLAGGGSAGHVSPLLALADALRRADPHTRITAIGTASGLEARLVPERGYDFRAIPKVAFPRRLSVQALSMPATLWRAVATADEILRSVAADVVVGFGGYVSTPAYLAARRRGIPIVVHEGNGRAGLANRLGARLTPYVATTFATTDLAHARVTGMPLRREITQLDRSALRAEALAHYGLRDDRPTLLVTGGSLGAQRLNTAFGEAAQSLLDAGAQVLHLSGHGKEFTPPVSDYQPYVVRAYADRMDHAYAAADLVVARSGANTVCELTAVGLPAIFVPLPIGNGEQRLNAADVVAAGGAQLVADADVDATWVSEVIAPLLADGTQLDAMAEASAHLGQPDADEQLAALVAEALASRATTGVRRGARQAGVPGTATDDPGST